MIIEIILVIILLYILGFIITPNHIFFTKIERTKKLERFAKKFKSKNKEETLRKVYNYIITNFSREKHNFILKFYKLFYTDVEKLLQRKEFAQCTIQNLILITLLVNTGQFKESDFRRRWTIINLLIPHQYVLVKINNKIVKVDPLLRKIFI